MYGSVSQYNPKTLSLSYRVTGFRVQRFCSMVLYESQTYLLTPSPDTLGKMFSSGTTTSSMTICPVMLALRENFPSILGVLSPCIPRSRIKPLMRLSSESVLAQMMNTSATGELVILLEQYEYIR